VFDKTWHNVRLSSEQEPVVESSNSYFHEQYLDKARDMGLTIKSVEMARDDTAGTMLRLVLSND
jgi:hypothetical protein